MTREKLLKFEKWLIGHGCEILPATNQYEAIRFKGRETGVLYTSGKTSNQFTRDAIKAFKSGSKWNGKPINVGRKSSYKKEKAKLLLRDGSNCFLCGEDLKDDITLEHLIPLSSGGLNQLSNMVLCHEKCNNQVGNMPISKKVQIAIDKRIKREFDLQDKLRNIPNLHDEFSSDELSKVPTSKIVSKLKREYPNSSEESILNLLSHPSYSTFYDRYGILKKSS